MDYQIYEGTIKWAKKRVRQLTDAETSIGCAIEILECVPKELEEGAALMDDQFDSDMFRSYAMDIQRLFEQLSERFEAMKKDRDMIRRGIIQYEKGAAKHAG